MSESMAASQCEPESTMTLEEVEAAMVEVEQRFIRLYQRFVELNGATKNEDKRKQFNPIRDLKISANRSYQWAHRAKCTAQVARERVIAAVKESLENNREEVNVLWKLLLRLRKKLPAQVISEKIPPAVMEYIELLYSQYNEKKKAKTATRKYTKRAAKDTILDTALAV
jgi:hypothetical protein